MKTLHSVLNDLNELIESDIEFPEAIWRMTVRYDLKPNEVQKLKDLYDAQEEE
jgi:hypothetical protein